MPTQILDTTHAETVSDIVLDILNETGYDNASEAIPGLISAILTLAEGNDQILDEAANLLADGE